MEGRIDRQSDVHRYELVQQAGVSTQHRYNNIPQHQNIAESESQAKVELEPQTVLQELDASTVAVSKQLTQP
jgi:hypothetical protein